MKEAVHVRCYICREISWNWIKNRIKTNSSPPQKVIRENGSVIHQTRAPCERNQILYK
jgi:hypothetical protein